MLTTSSDHKIYPKVLSSNIDSDTVVQKITIGRLASDGILWDGRSTKSVSAVDLHSYTMERVMPRLLYRKNGRPRTVFFVANTWLDKANPVCVT